MDFNHFLTSYMPDPNIGSKQHFKHMLDQSVLAEKLGYQLVDHKLELYGIKKK